MILVSIQCLVYNHEPYLRQCLDGFVMQKTNFNFEAIVHDDVSTDGSVLIIREYAEKYPDIIKPIYETENQYSKRDGSLGRIVNAACKGKYIALCEGDDYWTDPYKLQKQVDFLEANPEYVMVYTNAKKFYQGEGRLVDWNYGQQDNSFESLLLHNPVPTLTVLYKQDAVIDYQNAIRPHEQLWLLGDYPLWLWLSKQGMIKFLPYFSGVYRVLNESASHFKDYESAKRFILSSISIKALYATLFNPPNLELIEDVNNKNLLHLSFKYKEIRDLQFYFNKIKHKSIKDRLKLLIGYICFPRKEV